MLAPGTHALLPGHVTVLLLVLYFNARGVACFSDEGLKPRYNSSTCPRLHDEYRPADDTHLFSTGVYFGYKLHADGYVYLISYKNS